MKKIFAFFISLVMVFQVLAPVCSAKGYEIEMICVHNGLESKGFSVIEKDGELYAPTDELNWIFQKHVNSKGQKRFFLQENDVNLVFNLGEKNVLFSKTGKTIQVEPVSFTQEYSGTLVHEGIYYYPLSEILPWMNVECSVDNGILVIKPDMKSVWEISKEIKGDGLQFNIVDEMGQDTATVAALVTANVIDGFMAVFKGEFDRLIVIDENGDSWHTVNNYYDCLTEMATDDFMLSSQAEDILKSIKTVNKFDESLRELYEGTNTDEDLESFLSGYDFDKTVGADYGELCKQFEMASDMADLAQAAGKVLPVLKAVEASSHILPGYFDALLSQQSNEGNTKAYQMALDRSVDALSGNRSTIYTALTDFVADMWLDDAGSVLEEGLSSAEFLSGFGGAVGAVDAALTLIWPVNKAAEDVAKLSVYYNIQRSAFDTANSYKALATSENNTHLIRVNYMLSLLASKKSYEAMQKVLSLIGQDELKQGDLDKINLMLVELAYAESAEENDTACDKSGKVSQIAKLFKSVEIVDLKTNIIDRYGKYLNKTNSSIMWDFPDAEYGSNRDNEVVPGGCRIITVDEYVEFLVWGAREVCDTVSAPITTLYPYINAQKSEMTPEEFESFVGCEVEFSPGRYAEGFIDSPDGMGYVKPHIEYSYKNYDIKVYCEEDGTILLNKARCSVTGSYVPTFEDKNFEKYGKYFNLTIDELEREFPNAVREPYEFGGAGYSLQASKDVMFIFHSPPPHFCIQYQCKLSKLYPSLASKGTRMSLDDFEEYIGVEADFLLSDFDGEIEDATFSFKSNECWVKVFCEDDGSIIWDETVCWVSLAD